MKSTFGWLSFVFSLLFTVTVFAAEKTVVLSVENMTCNTCPITIKKALGKVKGVKTVKVDYEAKTATVTFDDKLTAPERLTQATRDAGFPATVRGEKR